MKKKGFSAVLVYEGLFSSKKQRSKKKNPFIQNYRIEIVCTTAKKNKRVIW